MKSRTAEYDSKRAVKLVKKQNSFSSKEQPIKKENWNRRMKSEERTTSIYLNPSHKKKKGKMLYEKSASNRMAFKQEFEDYVQASTSRKVKNASKWNKIDGMLPVVGNNSIAGYKINPTQVYSMISSLNNSGILLDQSTSQDKNSISINHKPLNSISGAPFKGKQFSGMNTAMINYIKDLDYIMMADDSSKNVLHSNTDTIHNYSVNYANTGKLGKKKSLILTSQKSTKRRSVERDAIKSKHKRSASDGNRIMSSKGRKKESSKSPPLHSAYYNKMVEAFSNTTTFPTKTLRKAMNKTKNLYNPNSSMLSKKGSKEYNSK